MESIERFSIIPIYIDSNQAHSNGIFDVAKIDKRIATILICFCALHKRAQVYRLMCRQRRNTYKHRYQLNFNSMYC